MRRGEWRSIALGLALILSTAHPAHALQYELDQIEPGKYVIAARGPIVSGDANRFRDFVLASVTKGAIVGFGFDSPGGSLLEGETIAGLVRTTGAGVIIPDNGTCASACFLILAAARSKFAGITALVGVHSASEGGTETLAAMGVTTAMARDASAYGVPPSIIGRMVTTEPGRIAWLTPAELVSMGVVMGKPNGTPSPPSLPNFIPATPPSSAFTITPLAPMASMPSMSLAFQQGKSDRHAWEEWFGSLTGFAHDGALFWASQRSLPRPTLCKADPVSDDWLTSCLAAQMRLAPIDVRRKSEPDYRAGWNSM